jgi:hypothetical protein
MRKKIFIAGPYHAPTSGGRHANALAAIDTGEELFKLGYCPFIPHLFHWWNRYHEHPELEWLKMDVEWLVACDALFRMEGASKGADREAATAIIQGKPVYYTTKELTEKMPPR